MPNGFSFASGRVPQGEVLKLMKDDLFLSASRMVWDIFPTFLGSLRNDLY